MESNVATAAPESILTWLNSFDVVKGAIQGYGDLVSGERLLDCLRTVMPDVPTGDQEPWGVLYQALEEYCGCSLTKSVSREELAAGDQEHIARAVVLFLSLAIEHKPNEEVIERMKKLEFTVQRDIMFYIEATVAKIHSHSIRAGTFTSGIGDALPTLGQTQFSLPLLENPAFLPETTPTADACDQDAALATPISRCPSLSRLKENYYSGLESPAGVRWLKAVESRRTPFKPQAEHAAADVGEEVPRLQHRVRVLERALETETTLSKEYYSDLCTKTIDNTTLERRCVQLEGRLEKLAEMQDLQDELDAANDSLARATAALNSCRAQVDSLAEYKEKAAGLEEQCEDNRCRLHQQDQRVEHLEAAVQERALELERANKAVDMARLDLQARESYTTDLLLENRELLKEKEALSEQFQLKVLSLREIQAALDEKIELEQVLTAQVKDLELSSERQAQALQSAIEQQLADFSSERTSLQEQLSSTQNQAQELTQALLESKEQSEQKMALKEKELADLQQARLDSALKSESERKHFEAETEELTQQLAAVSEDRNHLHSSLELSRGEVSKLKEEAVALTERSQFDRERLENKLQELGEQTASLKEEFEASTVRYNGEKESLCSEVERLGQALSEATQQFESCREGLVTEVASLQEQLRSVTEESCANSSQFEETKEALESEVKQLKTQLETEKTVAQTALAEMAEEMKTASEKHSENQKILRENFEKEIEALKQVLLESKEQSEQMMALKEKELADLQQALLDSALKSESERKHFEAETEELTQQLAAVSEDRNHLHTALELSRGEVSKLKEEAVELTERSQCNRETLENKLQELGEQTAALKEEFEASTVRYNGEKESLCSEVERLGQALSEATQQFESCREGLVTEVASLQEQLRSVTEESRANSSQFEETKEAFESEVKQLKTQLETEKTVAQTALAEMAEAMKTASEKHSENQKILRENSEKEIEALKQVLLESKEQSEQMMALKEKELADLQQALLDSALKSESERKRFEAETEELQQQLVEVSENNLANIVKFEGEREDFSSELSDLEQKFSSVSSEKAALQALLSELEKTLESLRSESAFTLNQRKAEQEINGREIESLRLALLESTANLLKEKENFQTQLEEARIAKAALQRDLSTLEQQLQTVSNEKEDLIAALTKTENDLESLRSESAITLSQRKAEQEINGREIESLRLALLESTTNLQKEKENFQTQLEEARRAKAALQRDLSTLEQQLQTVSIENDDLTAVLTKTETDLDSLRSESAIILDQRKAEQENNGREIESLRLALLESTANLQKEKENFQTQLEEARRAKAALQRDLSTLEQQLQTVSIENDDLTAVLTKTETDLDSLRSESAIILDQRKAEQENNGREIESLRLALLESTANLQKEKENFQTQLEEARRAKAALQRDLSTLEQQLQTVSNEKEDLTAALTKTENDLESLRSESAITLSQRKAEQEINGREIESLRLALLESTTNLQKEKENFQTQLEEARRAKAALQRDLSTLEQQLQTVSNEKDDLIAALTKTENDLECVKSASAIVLDQRKAEQEIHNKENESLKLALVEATEKHKHKKERLQAQLKRIEAESALADQRHNEALATLEHDKHITEDKYKKEIEQLAKEKDIIEDELEHAVSEKSTVLEASRTQLAALTKKTSTAIAEADQRVETLEESAEQLRRQLKSSQKEVRTTKELYQEALTKARQSGQHHSSQIQTLLTRNSEIVGKQEAFYEQLREENQARQQQKDSLDQEMRDLNEREAEATGLCKEFDLALQKERAKNTALKQHVQDVTTASEKLAEEKSELQNELNTARKLLAREQHRVTKLSAEVKSVVTQLNYASAKLRDLEKNKRESPPSPPWSYRASTRPSQSIRASTAAKNLNTEEEFFSHIHKEFDTMTEPSTIPSEIPSEEDDLSPDDERIQSAYQLNLPSKRATMAAPRPATGLSWDTLTQLRSSLAATRMGENSRSGEPNGGGKERIGELQRRNRDVLPHLKSSYPIELQVQPQSPSVSDERVKNGKRKAKQLSKRATMASTRRTDKHTVTPPLVIKRKRKTSTQRRDETADSSMRSPLPSRRRTSAPPTPQTPGDILVEQEPAANSRRFTVAPSSFKLREFLDHSEQPKAAVKPPRESTAFEIAFSPPKTFKAPKRVPKRLQENETRTAAVKSSKSRPAGTTFTKSKPTLAESTLRARTSKDSN